MITGTIEGKCRDSRRPYSCSATVMAHHYPPHTQTQGYQSYQTVPYAYTTNYYAGYAQRPGAPGYTFDTGVALTHPQGGPPAAPEIPGVSAQLASHALQRLISSEMRDAGFESAESGAIRRLELEVVACTYRHSCQDAAGSLTSNQSLSNSTNAHMSTRILQIARSQSSRTCCLPRMTIILRRVKYTV